MQVFFILFSVYFAIYQYINSKCLYRTHVIYEEPLPATLALPSRGLGWVGKVYQCTSVPAISINTPARAHTDMF